MDYTINATEEDNEMLQGVIGALKALPVEASNKSVEKRAIYLCLLVSVVQLKLNLIPSEWEKTWKMINAN